MKITRKSALKILGSIIGSSVTLIGVKVPIIQTIGKKEAVDDKSDPQLGPLLRIEQFSQINLRGHLITKRSETIESSRWGIHFNIEKILNPELDLALEKMAESGVKWGRVFTRGYVTSPEEGYYQWENLDQVIKGLLKRKITPFVTINKQPINEINEDLTEQTEDFQDEWLRYVGALVRRYRGDVKYWELLNEPIINASYAGSVKRASKLIKEIDPKAKVLAGSLARVDIEGMKSLLEDFGIAPFIDIITYHPYDEFPEGSKYNFQVSVRDGYNSSSGQVSEMRRLIESVRYPIELWQGECGFPSSSFTRSWKGRGPWGDNIQAKWLLRRFLTDFSMDIPVTTYFILHEALDARDDGQVNAKGLLVNQMWEPKPAFLALQHLTSIIDQRLKKPRNIEVDLEIHDEGSFSGIKGENGRTAESFSDPKAPYPIQVYGLSGKDGVAVVYYIPWRMQEYIEPARISCVFKNVSIQEPVLVDLLTGNVFDINSNYVNDEFIVRDIPLTDYPFMVINKDFVSDLEVEKP